MPTPTDCKKCGEPYYGPPGVLCDDCEKAQPVIIPLPLPDWLDGDSAPLAAPRPTVPLLPSPCRSGGLAALKRPVSTFHRISRIIRPFRRARLKRNIRAWMPNACRNPQGIEAEMVAHWSRELQTFYGE